MPSQGNTDKRAWTAASLDDRTAWYYPLPEACWTVFGQAKKGGRWVEQTLAALGQVEKGARFVEQLPVVVQLPDSERLGCSEALQPVRDALEKGRGFIIVEGPSGQHLSVADAKLLYWIVGQSLGQPFVQNVQGTMLYDVRDTGQDVAQGARFSVTNYESSFHTDNSFGTEILDYVGLLCLQAAKTGGRSQVLSGHAVYNELMARHPDDLATLAQPFHIDRRGGIREGDTPTIQFPVLHRDGAELLIRYLRYWIEAGHDKIGQPLTSAQMQALNVLDEIMKRSDLRVEFDLKPGQMYFINNRWILHNRTAFEDYPELERRRHLVRLWLQRR